MSENEKLMLEIIQSLAKLETKIGDIADLKKNFEELRDKIEESLKGGEVREQKIKSLEKRVEKLESNNGWLFKLFGAAIVAAIVDLILR